MISAHSLWVRCHVNRRVFISFPCVIYLPVFHAELILVGRQEVECDDVPEIFNETVIQIQFVSNVSHGYGLQLVFQDWEIVDHAVEFEFLVVIADEVYVRCTVEAYIYW